MLRSLFFSAALMLAALAGSAQTEDSDVNPKWDYQIYLKQPAKEIKEISYSPDCEPADGRLSNDRKTIVIKDYHKSRIYIKVIYEDGTEDEFIRSSCFIDPVI